jgi:hypothetical protein
MLAGMAAAGALALTLPVSAAPPRAGVKGDPEPLQHLPGLPEGFYRLGGTVLYVDARHMAWAPRQLDPARLSPIDLSITDLGELARKLRKRRFVFAVEHAVLKRLYTDRPLALALLSAALAVNCGPAVARLRHLTAAIASNRAVWRAVGADGRAFPTTLRRV